MGRLKGPYTAEFPIGSTVRVVDRRDLEKFMAEWALHNPRRAEQLEFGGRLATVREVGYYHGGDEVYTLDGLPGVWHEVCLRAAGDGAAA